MKVGWGLLALLLISVPAQASYRVYRLQLKNYDNRRRLDRIEYVDTTLDPYQYQDYRAGYRWMKVKMIDTWYCPGDTSNHRPYCKRPRVNLRGIASFDHPNRVDLPYNRQPVIP